MYYPEEITMPIRNEVTSNGFEELLTSDDVDNAMNRKGTMICLINSVCGCSARNARPAVKYAIENSKVKSDFLTTAFAGVHLEATEQVRKYTLPYPPSSPSIALFKDGKLVHFLERFRIEGSSAEMIGENIIEAMENNF